MNYSIIDFDKWKRASLFQYYINNLRIVMSLTVDIDVAPLLNYVRKNNLKFYPLMIWIVSKVINSHDEFKYGWDDNNNLIKWDSVSPSYTILNQDESFSKFVTEYSDNMFDFYNRVIDDQNLYRDKGIADNQLKNFFDVSCLPWVRYKHFDLHVFDEGKFLAPVVTWGKYEYEGSKVIMPLTMNIHHAVADGFHLSRFFNEVQETINSLIS